MPSSPPSTERRSSNSRRSRKPKESPPENVLRLGSQRPTLLHEPPEATDWTLSDIAVEFAESIGLELDDWQAWLVRWTFARRADRLWAARDVGAEVTRQSGKNIWLEVVELAGLFLFGDRLIVHSAHRADTSHEHFVSMKEHIEACDDLMDAMPTGRANNGFITTNGNESIELASGARLLFKARAKASGRGPRPQKIIFDEALVLEQAQVGSMAPGISAQKNPQIIFASSSPKADSTVLHGLRARAITPEDGDRLFYAAWNNPATIDLADRDAWYRVNPSLGYGRMTEISLLANRKLMAADEFLREHLGVPEIPIGDARDVKLPAAAWADTVGPDLPRDTPMVAVTFDVTKDSEWSSVAWSAGSLQSPYVEVREHRQGAGWLPDYLVDLVQREHPSVVACNGAGPAGAAVGPILAAFKAAGLSADLLVQMNAGEYKQACGGFYTDVVEGRLRRPAGQGPLDLAAADATERVLGDAWAWDRRSATVPISPLVAVTIARALLPTESPALTFAY